MLLCKKSEKKPILNFNTTDHADTIIDVDTTNDRVEVYLTETESYDLEPTIVDGERVAPPYRCDISVTLSSKIHVSETF